MGRGSSRQAKELLYGNKPRGSGPVIVIDPDKLSYQEIDRLSALAPQLPDDLYDQEHVCGDSRYDQLDWLSKFAHRALLEDGFTDTVVEETIIDEIDQGSLSGFTAQRWAEPHRDDEAVYREMLKEGKVMHEVINSFQESDLALSRTTLSAATNRLALRVALGRLAEGDTNSDHYDWRERQALGRLKQSNGDQRLGVTIPDNLLP